MTEQVNAAQHLQDECLDADDLDNSEERIFWSIPRDVRSLLTPDQTWRLLQAVKPVHSDHLIALRSSFMGIGQRYYVALFVGEDHRNIERLREEGQLNALPLAIVAFVGLAALTVLTAICMVFMIYLAKSALGIDLMDGPSPIHELICAGG